MTKFEVELPNGNLLCSFILGEKKPIDLFDLDNCGVADVEDEDNMLIVRIQVEDMYNVELTNDNDSLLGYQIKLEEI